MRHARVVGQNRDIGLICVFLNFEASYFHLTAPSIAIYTAHHLNRFWLDFAPDDAWLNQEFIFLDCVVLHEEFIFIV